MNILKTIFATASCVAVSVSAVSAQDELVKDAKATANAGVRIYRQLENVPRSILMVKPQLGMRNTLQEIATKLNNAAELNALSREQVDEYNRRAQGILERIDAAKQGEQQSVYTRLYGISNEIYTLAADINNQLEPVAAASLCDDGNCLAHTSEALRYQLKQVNRRISQAIADGTIDKASAGLYRREATRLTRSAGPETASKKLIRLTQRIGKEPFAIVSDASSI